MSKKLKKILIIIAGILAVLFVVGFVLYKIFVTPEVKVALTLLNAKEDISRSFDFYVDDNEKGVLDFVTDESGVSEYNLTFEKSPLFEGTSATLVTTGNQKSSVSQLKLNALVSLDIYADKSDIFINLPLFNGGLKIPLNLSAEEWKNSAFFDAYNALPHEDTEAGYSLFLSKNFSLADFSTTSKAELSELIRQTDVEPQKSDTVKIGDKDKKADVYLINLTEADMIKLSDIVEKYMESRKITPPSDIKTTLTEFAKNNKIYLKIRNYNLYEIEITGKENYTVAFSGEKNQFDNVTYYKNNKAQLSRTRTTDKDKTTDVLTKSGKKLLVLERDSENSRLAFDNGKTTFEITGSQMITTDDMLSYDNLEIKIGDRFIVSGQYSLSRRTSTEAVEFNKSGTYVDVTALPVEEWEAISSSISGLLNNIPFF